MKSFALSNAFIMRFTATRKWPIRVCFEAHLQIRFWCNFCQTFLVQFLLCSSLRFIVCSLRFCFRTLCDWLEILTPLYQPMRNKTKTSRDLLTRFPALGTGFLWFNVSAWVLIGSLRCLRLLWLASLPISYWNYLKVLSHSHLFCYPLGLCFCFYWSWHSKPVLTRRLEIQSRTFLFEILRVCL